MTSVPKPLKFLRPHYGTLKTYFETMPESDLKVKFVTCDTSHSRLLEVLLLGNKSTLSSTAL